MKGVDDPYVILAVGLEICLFRGKQIFDDSVDKEMRRKKSPHSGLRELNPEFNLQHLREDL